MCYFRIGVVTPEVEHLHDVACNPSGFYVDMGIIFHGKTRERTFKNERCFDLSITSSDIIVKVHFQIQSCTHLTHISVMLELRIDLYDGLLRTDVSISN
jgi:hypothetical protein